MNLHNWPNWNDLLSNVGRIVYTECKANKENEDKPILLKYYNQITCSITYCFCDTEAKNWRPGENDLNRRRGWSSAGNEKALMIPCHTPYEITLKKKMVLYVDEYLGKLSPYLPKGSNEYDFIAYEGDTVGNHGTGKPEKSPERKYGFWLIDPTPFPNVSASWADFVYAIFHTSKFGAHCDKAETNYEIEHSGSYRHLYPEEMWDTFTINHDIDAKLSTFSLTPDVVTLFKGQGYATTVITVEEAIALAGKWLKDGWKKYSSTLTFDDCINKLLGI